MNITLNRLHHAPHLGAKQRPRHRFLLKKRIRLALVLKHVERAEAYEARRDGRMGAAI